MTRIDYLNDPDAPAPNSIVPAASAVVTNDAGEILLQRRSDNDLWALPGGTMDLGERIADTVVREVREETGLDVEVTGIVGVYSLLRRRGPPGVQPVLRCQACRWSAVGE
jgi:ADP-ribose pyrophosphatase YjhB (NUDIX family)